jgi:hypothetical protein
MLQAEMPQDRYRALAIGPESQVFVSPRTVKVFSQGQDVFGHGEGI